MAFETCPLLDELPWLRHGFFQRHPAVRFDHTDKEENSPFLKELGLEKGLVYFNRHVFQDCIVEPDEWHAGIKADAWMTNKINAGLAVKTADCIPLMLVCPTTRLIANIHISWHCVLNEILPKVLKKFAQSQASLANLLAAIGPSIHTQSYPVQRDLYDLFAARAPGLLKFFVPVDSFWLLDMRGMVKAQLTDQGIKKIWQSDFDTFTSPDHYSFRKRLIDPASETLRNVSVIMKTA